VNCQTNLVCRGVATLTLISLKEPATLPDKLKSVGQLPHRLACARNRISHPYHLPPKPRKQAFFSKKHARHSACEGLVRGRYTNKVNKSINKLGGLLFGLLLLFGIGAIASSTAQAQYPWGYGQDRQDDRYRRNRRNDDDDWNRNDRYGRYGNNGYQIARQQGYSNGLSTGASDAQRGQSFNPQRSHFWRNGSDGWDRSYGNKGQFKQIFRDAFVQGYREGYSRYGGYNRRGNNGRWGNSRLPY